MYGLYNGICVLGVNAERECIHICKFLKQGAFSFHNRHTGCRADISQTQNSRTVCDDGYQVGAAGQLKGLLVILCDHPAGLGYARSVG